MTPLDGPRLSDGQSYYVIVGSAAAALIGVQFVVITLLATMRRSTSAETIGAFFSVGAAALSADWLEKVSDEQYQAATASAAATAAAAPAPAR